MTRFFFIAVLLGVSLMAVNQSSAKGPGSYTMCPEPDLTPSPDGKTGFSLTIDHGAETVVVIYNNKLLAPGENVDVEPEETSVEVIVLINGHGTVLEVPIYRGRITHYKLKLRIGQWA